MGRGVIDAIVPEPLGGAHRDVGAAAAALDKELSASLDELSRMSPDDLLDQRLEKFSRMGVVLP